MAKRFKRTPINIGDYVFQKRTASFNGTDNRLEIYLSFPQEQDTHSLIPYTEA